MKPVRPLLLVLGLVLLLLALTAGLALTPAVQGWAVRKAVAGTPGLALEFGRVAAGPRRLELQEVVVERSGVQVRLARLSADYSLLGLFGRRLVVERLQAEGLEIDLSRRSPVAAGAGAAGGTAVAPGAIAQVQLPWQIELASLDVRGRIVFPGSPGVAPAVADFQVGGGGLVDGQEGKFPFTATVRNDRPGAPVTALRTRGELHLHQAPSRSFDHVALELTLEADGPQIVGQSQLKLSAGVSPQAGAVAYSIRVDTVHGGNTENIFSVDATAPAQGARVTGRWSLQASDTQVGHFFIRGGLPKFTAKGAGEFALQTDTGAADFRGHLDASVSALEALQPALRALGTVTVFTEFDVATGAQEVNLNALTLRVAGDRPVLLAETKRVIAIDRSSGRLKVAPGSGDVGRLVLQGIPLAWVRPFVAGFDVSGGAMVGEFAVRAGDQRVEVISVAPVAVDRLSLAREGRLLLDRAAIRVSPDLVLGADSDLLTLREIALTTPAGDSLRWAARVELPHATAGTLVAQAQGEADLPALLTPLGGFGHLRGRGEFEFTLSPQRFELRSLRSEVSTGAGQRLLTATASRSVAVDVQKLQLIPSGPDEIELGRLAFDQVSLDQFPIVQSILPLRGEIQPGGFVVTAQGGRLFLRPTTALQVSGLTVESAGQRWIDGLTLQSSPTAEFGGLGDWKVFDGATAVKDRRGTTLLELNVEASASAAGLRAGASFNLDLAALGQQPALASWRTLASGRAGGEVRAAFSAQAVQVEARTTMNNLVAREGNLALPIANLSLRAVRAADGKLSLEAPLLLDRLGQRSDLKLTVNAVPAGGAFTVEARVDGEHLELEDALAIASLLGDSAAGATPPPVAAAPSAARAAQADARPAWHGFGGSVALEIKQLTRGKDWNATDLRGTLRIDPAQVRLEGVGAKVNDTGVLAAQADLAFRAGAQPYALQGNFSLTEFDVGAVMKAFDPGKPPVLEGVFGIAGKFAGAGATIDDLAARTRGHFELKSQRGVFRGLRRTSEKVSVATKAVDAVAALGSLFGSSKVKETAGKVAGQNYQIDQLAQTLAELPFDQFVVRAQRDEKLDFRIEELSLLSPEVRLTARGRVTHVEGRPLMEQPLSLSYQLAARGKVEQTLGRLKALDGSKDELGYAKTRDLGTISGTLAKPQTFLYGELLKLTESKLGEFFGN